MPTTTERLAPVPFSEAALHLSMYHVFQNTTKCSNHHFCFNSPIVTQINRKKRQGGEQLYIAYLFMILAHARNNYWGQCNYNISNWYASKTLGYCFLSQNICDILILLNCNTLLNFKGPVPKLHQLDTEKCFTIMKWLHKKLIAVKRHKVTAEMKGHHQQSLAVNQKQYKLVWKIRTYIIKQINVCRCSILTKG